MKRQTGSQMSDTDLVARLEACLQNGDRVAVADGVGSPVRLIAPLAEACSRVGDISWLLGWMIRLPSGLPLESVSDAVTTMGGYALRSEIDSGRIRYLPERMSALPKLLKSKLRPDVSVISARPGRRGLVFGSEVSWIRAATRNSRRILVEVNHALPNSTDGVPLPTDGRVTVVSEVSQPPQEYSSPNRCAITARLAEHVAGIVPAGSHVQFPPGQVGAAVLRSISVPVHVDSGILTDEVVGLADRGLLLGTPVSTYLVGTTRLYDWANNQPLLHPVEITHDLRRLIGLKSLIAINTALEIDYSGAVNVQGYLGRSIAGIGGQPDYASAASRSAGGLSIIALRTNRGGVCTLVDRLSMPASTPMHDVDIVATENGLVDLRGRDQLERASLLREAWHRGKDLSK